MRETRGSRYGKNLAVLIDYVFQNVSKDKREAYKNNFMVN